MEEGRDTEALYLKGRELKTTPWTLFRAFREISPWTISLNISRDIVRNDISRIYSRIRSWKGKLYIIDRYIIDENRRVFLKEEHPFLNYSIQHVETNLKNHKFVSFSFYIILFRIISSPLDLEIQSAPFVNFFKKLKKWPLVYLEKW